MPLVAAVEFDDRWAGLPKGSLGAVSWFVGCFEEQSSDRG
jgi:hypothetical protein